MTKEEYFKQLILDTEILSKSSNSKEYRDYVKTFLTKELLEELISKYSINYICNFILKPKGYKIVPASLIERCKNLNIKTLSIKEQRNSKKVRDSYKKTCLKKYGFVNALSKNTKPFKKRNQTVKNKYGVSNVFQVPEIIQKSKKTMIEKYGVTCASQLPLYERNFGRTSKIHIKIENFLKENNISYESEKLGFLKFNKFFNKLFSPKVDILIKNQKIIIEIYGDYWHANPKKYSKDFIVARWGGKKRAEEIWHYDKIRINHLKSFGYKIIILWESDIKNKFEKIKRQLIKLKREEYE